MRSWCSEGCLDHPVCMSARTFTGTMQTVNRMNARPTTLHVDENICDPNVDYQPNERSADQSACRRECLLERCRLSTERTVGVSVCMSARTFPRTMQIVNRMNARRTSLHVDENISQNDADCQPNERSPYQSACRREHFPERCRLSTERTVGLPVCRSARTFARAMQTVNRMNGRPTSLYVDENICQSDADCQPNERSQTDCDHSIVGRHNRLTTRAANLQSFCNWRDNLATRVANRLPSFRSREEITD
jgi:hypothetical protein